MPASPVVLSVPHAGRRYSKALLKAARVGREALEGLEDRLVDRLVWRAVEAGCAALVADVPRAEIDLNRDEREIDPAIILPSPPAAGLIHSARARGGLGLIPSRIGGAGAVWRQRIPAAEVARRLAQVHRPYHAALAAHLAEARARFGIAILLDCHSMPPRERPDRDARIVLGDRHGTSIAPDLMDAAAAAVEANGLAAGRNAPYAGGHITERHGRPGEGIHALQLEIDRSLYLTPDLRSPGPGFERIARLVAEVAEALAARALGGLTALAAE